MGLRLSNLIITILVIFAVVILPSVYLMMGGGFVAKNDLFFYATIGVIGATSWSIWAIRRAYTLRYAPAITPHSEPVSVVTPVWHEDKETFKACMDSIRVNLRGGDEMICVFDHTETDCMEVKDTFFPEAKSIIVTEPGKRYAVARGIEAAKNDVVILCDSDVIWDPNLEEEILKPFADPKVGGVGTRQKVANADGSIMRRIASWWLDAKLLDYMPGLSTKGVAIVLSGRTAAYRRSVVLPMLNDFENEYLFGTKALSGDDGRMTSLVLKAGYKTVYQSTAILVSAFPSKFKDFVKQRVRWARNSNRCYFKALGEGWAFRKHPLLPLTIIHTQLSSFTILFPFAAICYATIKGEFLIFVSIFVWVNAARYVRGYNHLKEAPQDVWLTPLITFFLMVVFPIIKVYSLITLNRQIWLGREEKRSGDYNWAIK